MATLKLPTIKDLLNSMPSTGTDTHEDRLATYASLSFYWDGKDRKQASVKAISKTIQAMDSYANSCIGSLVSEQVEDEDNDKYGVSFKSELLGLSAVEFISPSLNNLPKRTENQPVYYRDCIEKLATNPDDVMGLPYLYFSEMCTALGKSLGLL